MKREEIRPGAYVLMPTIHSDAVSGVDYQGEDLERIVSVTAESRVMTASLTDDERHEYLIEEGDFDDARCVDPDLAERIWRALLTFFHAKMESLTSGIPASYNPGEESVDQHAAAEKSSDFLKSGFANTADRM